MTVRFQVELSDEEDRIIEVYKIEHKKKNREQAIKEIIRHYKPLSEFKEKYEKKNKKSWLQTVNTWLNEEESTWAK